MKHPVKILVDWGGTIIRDDKLFEIISENSNNKNVTWHSPECWNDIKSIGNENYFDKIKKSFLKIGDAYSDSIPVISSFCGNDEESESQIYIVFDNKPDLEKISYKTKPLACVRGFVV